MAWVILGDQIPDPLTVDDGGTSLTVDGAVTTSGTYTSLTGNATANNVTLIDAGDVRGYKSYSLQITGTGTIAVQGSNDNATWANTAGYQLSTLSPTQSTTMLSGSIWGGPVTTHYLRIRTTAHISGTTTAYLELSGEAFATPPIRAMASTATLTNITNTGAAATLIANNPARRGLTIYNDCAVALYAKYGSSPSTTSFTYYLEPYAHFEMPATTYTGDITGIWVNNTAGAARITEWLI